MPLATELAEYIRACFTGLWITTHEQDDALAEIATLCHQEGWPLVAWDIDQGMRAYPPAANTPITPSTPAGDPLAAIRALGSLAQSDGSALLVLVNFHRFLGSPEIIQALAHQLSLGKQQRTFVIILAPTVQIPLELEKQFLVLEHELPSREQLVSIARGVAHQEGELPSGEALERILDASSGLTRYEAEGAYSLSLVRHGRVTPETIWELKSQLLKKSNLLTLHRGGERFDDLGGLDSLKAFCLRALRPGASRAAHQRPRGVLLISPPGCGKTQFCKALGNETGRPTIVLDIGSLLGSLVGQSEEQTRRALRIIDAMQPAVVLMDEVEKALSGVASSGQTDSGVSARLFGTLLGWLNDHTSDVFVVATSNDISKLPPEFSRAERFDGVFMVDLPQRDQKDRIWEIYLRQFELDTKQRRPSDDQWTGAEIRSCCRLACLLDVPLVQAAQNVVPVAVTAAESVEKLRTWASGRCLSADRAGLYRRDEPAIAKTTRRVSRDPSNN